MTREELGKRINELETALGSLYMERENREKIFRKERFKSLLRNKRFWISLVLVILYFAFLVFYLLYAFNSEFEPSGHLFVLVSLAPVFWLDSFRFYLTPVLLLFWLIVWAMPLVELI